MKIVRRAGVAWSLRIRLFYFAQASKIQRSYRGFCARRRFRRMVVDKKGENAATIIQSNLARGVLALHNFRAIKFVTVTLSAVYRGYKLRLNIARQNAAALLIGKYWRGMACR